MLTAAITWVFLAAAPPPPAPARPLPSCCTRQCSCGCNAGRPCDPALCHPVDSPAAGAGAIPAAARESGTVRVPALAPAVPPTFTPPPHPYTAVTQPLTLATPAYLPTPAPGFQTLSGWPAPGWSAAPAPAFTPARSC